MSSNLIRSPLKTNRKRGHLITDQVIALRADVRAVSPMMPIVLLRIHN